MPPIVIDMVIAGLILGITYALMSEGLWGAATMFFNVLFAGIIAFNFYEPLAALLDGTGIGWGFSDTLCMMSLFIVSVTLLRLTTESIAPSMVRFPPPVYHAGRVFFAFGGAVVTVAIILLSYETAPVHKKVFKVVDWKYEAPFGRGIDRDWLGFFQYTTGLVFADNAPRSSTPESPARDPYGEYGAAKVFDPRGEWLFKHQDARPYGLETVLEEDKGGAAGGDKAATPASGGTPSSSNGARPGDPVVVGPAVGGGVVVSP